MQICICYESSYALSACPHSPIASCRDTHSVRYLWVQIGSFPISDRRPPYFTIVASDERQETNSAFSKAGHLFVTFILGQKQHSCVDIERVCRLRRNAPRLRCAFCTHLDIGGCPRPESITPLAFAASFHDRLWSGECPFMTKGLYYERIHSQFYSKNACRSRH